MHKLGLMGCGTVANYGHIPAIKQSPEFELTAIYEPDSRRTAELQSLHNVKVYTDLDEFFHAGFDAVVITSPAPEHYQNVVDAALNGKHVLCEKPLAMDDREAADMISLMNNAGLMLFTAFDYRFSPVSTRIKRLVEDGSIGEVSSLRLSYIWNNHGKYLQGNGSSSPQELNLRRQGRMLEGGPMVDCGVHQIDLARWWLNSEVIDQHAEGAWVDDYEAPDHLYLHLRHANRAHTLVEISYSYCFTAKEAISHFEYLLIGSEGIIRYDREAKLFEMRNSSGTTQFPFDKEKNFPGMYKAFAAALQTGEAGRMPNGLDGLMAIRIAREATEDVIKRRLCSS